jgi:hypothetical protein
VLVPMAAYASPLWNNALADTPVAYMIWIPVLAMAWAAWNLTTIPAGYADDAELNALIGVPAVVIVGVLLAVAPEKWPAQSVYYEGALLLWPLWALAMTWLTFGVGVTTRVLGPFAYWLLGWPPVFTWIADRTQGILVNWSIQALNVLESRVNWIHAVYPVGNFVVQHGGTWVTVVIAQACSGADSLLGAAILLPLIFAVLKGLVLNWIRLAILVAGVHWIGPTITFDYIHPVLGFLLFALLGVVLALLLTPLGLKVPGPEAGLIGSHLSLPGRGRLGVGSVIGAGLFAALLPLFQMPPGYAGNPRPVSTASLTALMPRIAGFTTTRVYYANESSILGSGSATVADIYTAKTGASVLAEVWGTPSLTSLQTYGFKNCLVYHGDNITAQHSFTMPNGLVATAYEVALPPDTVGGARSTYVDVEWTSAVKDRSGTVMYLRWSVAAVPLSRLAWPHDVTAFSTGGPVSGLDALAVAPDSGTWHGLDLTYRQDLSRFAGLLADTHPLGSLKA